MCSGNNQAPLFFLCCVFWFCCVSSSLALESVVTRETRKKFYSSLSLSQRNSEDDDHEMTNVFVDLSELHNLPGTTLANILVEILDTELDGDDENHPEFTTIHVDVSHSALRDQAFESIVDTILFPTNKLAEQRPDGVERQQNRPLQSQKIQLSARMNQLTPKAFRYLIDKLLNSTLEGNGVIENDLSKNKTEALLLQNTTAIATSNSELRKDNDTGLTEQSLLPSGLSNNRSFSVRRQIESLDVCWNSLHSEDQDLRSSLERSLEKLIQRFDVCPTTLRLEHCGLEPSFCHALGKGLMARYNISKHTLTSGKHGARRSQRQRERKVHDTNVSNTTSSQSSIMPLIIPLSLYLSGNRAIQDAGAAAIAAAVCTICSDGKNKSAQKPPLVLNVLDLSACSVTDVGAKALSLALECSSSLAGQSAVIRRLNLSHNKITDDGAVVIAQALMLGAGKRSPKTSKQKSDKVSQIKNGHSHHRSSALEEIDLSDNKNIGDRGTALLGEAMEKGCLTKLLLRSCSVYADGAASIGNALRALASQKNIELTNELNPQTINQIDLSGNPLGMLRKEGQADETKYSASRLTSKASATAASYMNQGFSFLKKGLKDVGMDVTPLLGSLSAESDDEEERAAIEWAGLTESEMDPANDRCGAKALVNAFLEYKKDETSVEKHSRISTKVHLGLRHCFLDHGAADALAALLVAARERGLDLELDVSLNPILEEEMVLALHGDTNFEDLLQEMAERYHETRETVHSHRGSASKGYAPVRKQKKKRTKKLSVYEISQ